MECVSSNVVDILSLNCCISDKFVVVAAVCRCLPLSVVAISSLIVVVNDKLSLLIAVMMLMHYL
jgi:hypothetical protein